MLSTLVLLLPTSTTVSGREIACSGLYLYVAYVVMYTSEIQSAPAVLDIRTAPTTNAFTLHVCCLYEAMQHAVLRSNARNRLVDIWQKE